MQITISGASVKFLEDTFDLDDTVEERSTCSFTVRDDVGTAWYYKGQPVIVTVDDERVFGGVIDSAERFKPAPGNPMRFHMIKCADWHYLADKRVIAKSYQDTTAGDIVSDIVKSKLSSEGVLGCTDDAVFTRASVAYKSDGTQVASGAPRFESGGLIVEEGTTNLLTANQASVETDLSGLSVWPGTVAFTRDTSNHWHGAASAKCVNGGSAPEYMAILTSGAFTAVNPSTAYVFSVYGKAQAAGRQWVLRINWYDSGMVFISSTGTSASNATPTWTRLSLAVNSPVNAAYCYAELALLNAVNGEILWWDGAQLEQKSHATSWHLPGSSRVGEVMTVPTSGIFAKGDWTVEGTFVPQIQTSIGNVDKSLVYCYIDANNFYKFVVGWGGEWHLNIKSGGVDKVISGGSTSIGVAYSWMIAGNGSVIRVCVNGLQIGSDLAYSEPVGTLPVNAYIGSNASGAAQSNGIIGNLRISSRARTLQEHQAAYAAQAWPLDEKTIYLLPLTSGLAPISHIQDGPTVKEAVFNYSHCSDCIDSLAEKANFSWQINQYKIILFHDRSTYAAPWALAAADIVDKPVIKHGNPEYRNTQFIKGGRDETDIQTQYFSGDDTQQTFTLGFPLAKKPVLYIGSGSPIVYTLVNSATVGIKGLDTGKAWYWNKEDPTITQDSAGTPLTTVQKLKVEFYGLYDVVAVSQDPAQVNTLQSREGAGSGIVEAVADEAYLTSADAAFQVANSKLQRYAVDGVTLKYTTRRAGLRPGMLQTVNLPADGLNGVEMLIESVRIYRDGGDIWYDISALQGPAGQSWTMFFYRIAKTGKLVVRQNISESQILVQLETSAETASWSELTTTTVYVCPVPANDLYPSSTLYPC